MKETIKKGEKFTIEISPFDLNKLNMYASNESCK